MDMGQFFLRAKKNACIWQNNAKLRMYAKSTCAILKKVLL